MADRDRIPRLPDPLPHWTEAQSVKQRTPLKAAGYSFKNKYLQLLLNLRVGLRGLFFELGELLDHFHTSNII